MDATILDSQVAFYSQPFRTPLVLSTGPITELTEAVATVRVRVAGREASGQGSIYLSDLWAWPDEALSHEQRDDALRQCCEDIAAHLPALCGNVPAHPLPLGLHLHEAVCEQAAGPPVLARAMCLSPFDAAIHDATGQALGVSAFRYYEDDCDCGDVDGLFTNGACPAIRRMLRREPVRGFPVWWIVGKADDLAGDFAHVITERACRCFKLKIMGVNSTQDVARTVEVYRAAKALGAMDVRLTVDSNEANPDAASVQDYLERLRAADGEAFEALEYLEQPTDRDIVAEPHDWRTVAALKPVLLDEGLTSLERLANAAAQHWSGLALKTCKGHSFALAAAAWAHERGLPVSLQDLTNPGLSGIHAALFAAHVPTINGVELNSPQFTPAANDPWLPRLACLFDPADGVHRLPATIPPGLGSRL